MQTTTKQWQNPEHAIMQRRHQEDHEAHFQGYARELHAIRRNAEWHETYEKLAVAKQNIANEKKIDQELEQANEELKILRNKRLSELYSREWQQWEAELNAQGLAILKDRL